MSVSPMSADKRSVAVVAESGVHSSADTESTETKRRRKQVLDEDVYVQYVEDIIERDFYPDLPQMRQQLRRYESVDRPLEAQRFAADRPIARTGSPSTFETPLIGSNRTTHPHEDNVSDSSVRKNEPNDGREDEADNESVDKNVSLDKFLNRFTSEDNQSFEEIQDEEKRRHREKYSWLYQDESAHNASVDKLLELPSIERQAIEYKPSGGSVVTWPFKNQNSVMYNLSALPLTDEERAKAAANSGPSVVYSNTRFARMPFNERVNQRTIAMAAQLNHRLKEGKIGIDGKELVSGNTPQINGHKFVASTPTPAPDSYTESPLMTWGEIEGTPYSLSGSETPLAHPALTPGASHFKIPDLPHREKIGHSLAAKTSQQNRDKKKSAVDRAHASLHPSSPAFYTTKTPIERLNSMSPAAQKLAKSKLGVHRNADQSLMASYSPASSGVRTPGLTPRSDSSRGSTPFDSPLTPKLSSGEKANKKDINSRINEFSTKQNRNKAKDFF